jgi:hypothetical protein
MPDSVLVGPRVYGSEKMSAKGDEWLKGLSYKERSERTPLKKANIFLRLIFETDVVIYEILIKGGFPEFREKTIDFLTNLLNITENIVNVFPRTAIRIRDRCFELLNWVGEFWNKEKKEN